QVIEGAAEQSGRTRLPVLHAVSDLQTLLARAMSDPAETRYVAHPGGGAFSPPGENCQRCLIAIGPEGGFSTNEIQSMTGTGFTAVSLGPRILRAETAPAVALSLLQYMSGDLSG
ncbi:MAG: RsmE family RNA methyltransferase, partial [Gammaproteobacteria bacterium]